MAPALHGRLLTLSRLFSEPSARTTTSGPVASCPPKRPQAGVLERSNQRYRPQSAPSLYSLNRPHPPRNLPGPPESGLKPYRPIRAGYLVSYTSTGRSLNPPLTLFMRPSWPSPPSKAPHPPGVGSSARNGAPFLGSTPAR